MRFFDRLGTETKRIKARVYLELARQCMSLMDYEKMIEYLNKAIELGSLDAKNVLGTCYYNGYGVVQDYGKAASILKEVAEQGHAGAQSNLALLYLNGLGTETNYKAAYLRF